MVFVLDSRSRSGSHTNPHEGSGSPVLFCGLGAVEDMTPQAFVATENHTCFGYTSGSIINVFVNQRPANDWSPLEKIVINILYCLMSAAWLPYNRMLARGG